MPDQDRTANGSMDDEVADPALERLLGEAVPTRVIEPPSSLEVEAALAAVLARRGGEAAPVKVVALDAYRSRWRGSGMRAAAAVLVVAGAGLLWRATQRNVVDDPAAPSRFATAPGALDSIQLGDGTRVLLGPGSALTVAEGFGSATREVTLTGDARFDVVHDDARPFVVHTAAAAFRDVGTVFVVQGAASGDARVAVTEGAVAVMARGATDSVVLRAGDRASVAAGGAMSVERSVSTADDVAWTTGRLVLRDVAVAQLVSDVRRWYNMDLRVDSALVSHRVNATFERGAVPGDVARVVAALLGGGVEEVGGTFRIVAPPGAPPPR